MLKPDFELRYEGKTITEDIKPYLIDVTYTDYLSDQSDEIAIVLEDKTHKWIDGWFPTQGDKLGLSIGYAGQELVNVGSFEIDEIEFDYDKTSGSVVSIKALSTGISKANRTLQPKPYENTTLKDIVSTVAKRLKLKVTGEVRHVPIHRETQYQERDVEFLTRLAHKYGHSFKIVNDTLVFTTMDSLKRQASVEELSLDQVISINLKDRIKNTAKKVEVKGYNAKAKKQVKATKDSKHDKDKNADTLKIVSKGESAEQMQAQADAATDSQDERQAGEVKLIGNPKLVAGNNITIKGFGKFSGKYLIKQADHSISRSQGYITELEIRLIEHIPDSQDNQTQGKSHENA